MQIRAITLVAITCHYLKRYSLGIVTLHKELIMKTWLIALMVVAGTFLGSLALLEGGSVAVDLGPFGSVHIESPAKNTTRIAP
jgi:hypothetical protein